MHVRRIAIYRAPLLSQTMFSLFNLTHLARCEQVWSVFLFIFFPPIRANVASQGTKNAFKRYAKSLDMNILRDDSFPADADMGMASTLRHVRRVRAASITNQPHALHFSPTTEADEYVSNLSQSASLRVMLINRVVIGNAYKIHRNAPQIVPLLPEYNSVRLKLPNLSFEWVLT